MIKTGLLQARFVTLVWLMLAPTGSATLSTLSAGGEACTAGNNLVLPIN